MATGLFRELHGMDVQAVANYLEKACDLPFEQSELYVVADGENRIDTTRRVSEFRKIRDVTLFNLVEPLVSQLSKNDPIFTYTLVRNDVTHIRYKKGGFFTKHQDYVSVTSNMLEEFSMLVCVTPEQFVEADQGGKTVIHMKRDKFVSDATTTPGCALAFRKDLEHESTVLKEGEKHIIMLNLWAVRKDAGGILLINFRDAEAKAETRTTEDSLRKLASDDSYVIPVTEAQHSPKLADHIASCDFDDRPVSHFMCADTNYEGFGTVFRILRRMYVSAQEVELQADLIREYGLDGQHIFVTADGIEGSAEGSDSKPGDAGPQHGYSASNRHVHNISISMMDGSVHNFEVLLTDIIKDLKQRLKNVTGKSGLALLAANSNALLDDHSTLEACGSPTRLIAFKQTTKVDEYKLLGVDDAEVKHLAFPENANASADVDEDGSDVILCESLARAKVVAEAAKTADLPFVRFEVLLVEGMLGISGDTCRPCEHNLKMDPAFISVGDCGHVLGLGSVSSVWNGGGTWWEAAKTLPSTTWWGGEEIENPRLYNLQSVLKPNINTMNVMKYVFGDCDREVMDEDLTELVEEPAPAEMQDHSDLPRSSNAFFHINVDGKTCFTSQQASYTSEYLKNILFIDQLKSQIDKVPWELPQSSKSRSETLCNERVYGHINVLMAAGVVRLSDDNQGSVMNRGARRERLLQVYRGAT
mmetsp:Transcript_12590/g.24652  ORF Transcript_12590/g.24652 Transcript_12590/m.24652 type:complete len:701 (+) Transcript_12590:41-2143(+)|eukprot:CAMPEP_0172663032 /NCGR_PEP_ID=MMETSP1074-20121228/5677_1 /TAXON_ID=2916 /ORGANISM="Ceratium fusus, Strain PA161109" /LENGTH=700 /DNA_ID=CAMNT_0013478975 /DNA_START=42 /DNA_END=2144 /DNA_ORIENTATION=-